MNKAITLTIVLISLIICLHSCSKEGMSPEQIDFDQLPYEKLSEYGFFAGAMKDMQPAESVLAYRPNSELFSDYAEKKRFVWMPKGTSASIEAQENGRIVFPDKSILIKNFYYSKADGDKQRIIETRLLVKHNQEWQAYAYVWNEQQTEAQYEIVGASIPVDFTGPDMQQHSIDYIQPNKNQCKTCHNVDEQLRPIGPKVQHLNFDFKYANANIKNQLQMWTEMGYLSNYIPETKYDCMVDYRDDTQNLDLRARAYLDMNCAHCHSSVGSASSSGLLLNYNETNQTKIGLNKPPIAAGLGAGPHKFDILPGKADSSIFVYRMESTRPGVMMPELGRSTVHKEGVQLVRDWIDSLQAAEDS